MLTKDQLDRICMETGVRFVLAGGALRDEYLGLGDQIKDYDLFFYDDGIGGNIDAIINTWFKDQMNVPAQDYGNVSECSWQAEATLPGIDRPVNFVAIKAPYFSNGLPDDVIARCDFGICQMAWDGDRYYTTGAFHKDIHNKTFTLRPDIIEPGKLARSQRRWDKFKDRYPDFTVVYTPEQQEILKQCSTPIVEPPQSISTNRKTM